MDPAQTLVTPDERMRFINAINEKRAAIGAHAADAAIKGLADVKLASLGDLKNLFAYAAQTRTMQDATTRLMPEFKAKLDAAPASLADVAEANTTLLQLAQVSNQVAAAPAYQTYYKAMQDSRDAMAKSVMVSAPAITASRHSNSTSARDLGDILATLDADQFQRCFVAWVASVIGVSAIDGKTVRRSKAIDKDAIHMVSAFAPRQRLVMGQVKVADKANEILAIPGSVSV